MGLGLLAFGIGSVLSVFLVSSLWLFTYLLICLLPPLRLVRTPPGETKNNHNQYGKMMLTKKMW